jgi:HTH-type transcriptional regulator/antitoxin HigA
MIMATATGRKNEDRAFTPSQYYSAMAEIEDYIAKGFENLNEKEATRLDQLSDRVHEYETHKYPMPMPNSVSAILQGYMTDNNVSRAKLSSLLQVSASTISDILNEKKGISFPLAIRIHQVLKIDAETLLNVRLVPSGMTQAITISKNQKLRSDRTKIGPGSRVRNLKSSAKKATRKK